MATPRNPTKTTFTMVNLTAVDVQFVIGTFIEVGRITPAAGTALALGYGARYGQHDASGRMFSNLVTVAALAIQGVMRFMCHNPLDRPDRWLTQATLADLRAITAADRGTWVPAGFIDYVIPPDWSLVVQVNATGANLMAVATSTLQFDATLFEYL